MTDEQYKLHKLKRERAMMHAEGQALLIILLGFPIVVLIATWMAP